MLHFICNNSITKLRVILHAIDYGGRQNSLTIVCNYVHGYSNWGGNFILSMAKLRTIVVVMLILLSIIKSQISYFERFMG